MKKKEFSAEQIIGKLREAEVLLSRGSPVGEVSRKLGVTKQTYYRWRREYGGMRLEQAPDGKKEIIDFRQVAGESKTAWEGFLNHLYQRGLEGHALKLIVVDGGKGLLAAIDLVYGQVPLQRCWAHKTRNVLNHVKRADQEKVKRWLHRISHARNLREAQKAAQRFVLRWKGSYPKAVECRQKDLLELLAFLEVKTGLLPPVLRTTNAIERRFREVRRRSRPMGTFSDRTSMERILYSVFSHENLKQRTATPFLFLIQNNRHYLGNNPIENSGNSC
jgi:transposase-like protein